MDFIIDVEEMKFLEKWCQTGADAAEGMKNCTERLRNAMANMYSGEAYDELQDSCRRLESQYIMIQQSYKKLKDYVHSTKATYTYTDGFTEDRMKESMEITSKKNQEAYAAKHQGEEDDF